VSHSDPIKAIRSINKCAHLTDDQCKALISEMDNIDWSSRVIPDVKSRSNEIAYQRACWLVKRAKEMKS